MDTNKSNNSEIENSTSTTTTLDKNKMRKVINVSIQKKSLVELNSILNMWEDDMLNLSNEVCKSILFKHEFENNPVMQTLLSTIKLIKTNLKNKELFKYTEEEAFIISLKNLLSIKVNPNELCDFLENDLYFSNDNKPVVDNNKPIATSKPIIDNTINNTQNINRDEPKIPEKTILHWNIPESTSFTKNEEVLNTNSEGIDNSNQNTEISNEDINNCFSGFSYSVN